MGLIPRSHQGLVALAAVLLGAWLLLRYQHSAGHPLPWNQGQAGSIFGGGHGGGGQ